MFVVCDDGMCSCPHDWSIGPLKHWVYRNLRMVVVNRRIYWWQSAYYGVGWVMLCVDYLVLEPWCSCWFGRWMTLFGRDWGSLMDVLPPFLLVMEGGNGHDLRYVEIDEMYCLDKIRVHQWM